MKFYNKYVTKMLTCFSEKKFDVLIKIEFHVVLITFVMMSNLIKRTCINLTYIAYYVNASMHLNIERYLVFILFS